MIPVPGPENVDHAWDTGVSADGRLQRAIVVSVDVRLKPTDALPNSINRRAAGALRTTPTALDAPSWEGNARE